MMRKLIANVLLSILCLTVISIKAIAEDTISYQAIAGVESFVSKRICKGPCTAGTCPVGYTVSSTSCNCNSSCKCKGNTTCEQAGGGTVRGGACAGGCTWTFVAPIEKLGVNRNDGGDQAVALLGYFGPRIKSSCSGV